MKRSKRMTDQSKRRRKTVITSSVLGFVLAGFVSWIGWNDWDVKKSMTTLGVAVPAIPLMTGEKAERGQAEGNTQEVGGLEEVPPPESPPVVKDSGGYIEGMELPSEPTYINGILIANKEYPLPSTYAPGEDAEAREAFNEMAAEAALSDLHLTAFSTYRSFEYQQELYDRYVARDGEEAADRYSARPGYSEHQTGLAFDIGEVNYEQYWASSEFGETEAGKWLAANAHRYGFIMRYPLGKEEVTGYMHESWHFRYVGQDIAKEIFEKNITLEEYVGIK